MTVVSNCEIHSPKLTSWRKATSSLGYHPVIFIVVKAKALDQGVANSILSLARDICKKAKAKDEMVVLGSDPLLTWLVPSSCGMIRKIEHSIQELLIDKSVEVPLARYEKLHKFSTLALFFLYSKAKWF
ncbi:hypothetical protein [Desulfoscipio gibsoniae]|uniref:Uncharacterized protein n=1 Tax=Desulfoscipio gibsoniae DSM 7213 TaxID=767817 RepID=R4K9F8_9FIRM|nr:hypothetical protein [Desulfoscipio gibsoniae]AGK99802.1 hypothetical protein Desgi_0196 [Desulfoscipio gibsoniae DSM 7213]